MARCEDFPCCGHEAGECPTYNAEGKRLCVECDRPAVYYGRCRACCGTWQRRMKEYAMDETGQDAEAWQ